MICGAAQAISQLVLTMRAFLLIFISYNYHRCSFGFGPMAVRESLTGNLGERIGFIRIFTP
jgi:hypothetical protein